MYAFYVIAVIHVICGIPAIFDIYNKHVTCGIYIIYAEGVKP